MNLFILPMLSVLLFWCAACTALPFLVLRDRRLARLRKRAIFDKRASQLSSLCALMSLLWGAALCADAYFHGRMDSVASTLSRPLWLIFVGGECLAAVLVLCSFLAGKRRVPAFLGALLGGCVAVCSYLIFILLLWSFLRGEALPGNSLLPSAPGDPFPAEQLIRQMIEWFAAVPVREDWALSGLALGFFCFLPPVAAYMCALLWYLLRRGVDDFGRDYYLFAVGGGARRAAWSGALLLPFAAGLLWVTPPCMVEVVNSLPFRTLNPGQMALLYNILPLCRPLAVFCCYLPCRFSSPLRGKSLMVLAPCFLLVGIFAMLVRLWG